MNNMLSNEFNVLDGKMDLMIEHMENRFNGNDKRHESHDKKFERVFDILEKQTGILTKLDQEHAFVVNRNKEHGEDIELIKK